MNCRDDFDWRADTISEKNLKCEIETSRWEVIASGHTLSIIIDQ